MNYIRHLNAVFQLFSKDSRLNPSHISLYMALFQYWNLNRFPESFLVDREETMSLSKIGSKSTYHRCLSNLNDWKYIAYQPSYNRFKGSRIMMPIFGTSPGQVVDKHETGPRLALVSYINNNKHNKTENKHLGKGRPKTIDEVMEFFKKNSWPVNEADKFFNHYQGIGWKVGGKSTIVDWKATAQSWMIRAKDMKEEKAMASRSHNRATEDYLDTSIQKDYGEPL
ncbi:hypothetical protein EHW67_09425 [Arenibacter aquaticus]|uniref:Uncharacterized protein n=1 Tax=Arenibacter aquaticus TaxID=2489054 RepID=A0A3S0C808_9FLAO|nr:hypothetical protein [Arenibacter aquaticus]RTE54132.1 hypothetical protein EHW67_09425 [Arenibacter aquaticus]